MPWRATIGSVTPSSSTRLRSVVMFCWIAKSCRCLIWAGLSVTVDRAALTERVGPTVRLGSWRRSSTAARFASAPLRNAMRTVPSPSLEMPVKGIRSVRNICR